MISEILSFARREFNTETISTKSMLRNGASIFSILFVVYLGTMPLTIALEDDGLFVLSNFELGLSHPPGYPLHTIIGHIFSTIPIGSVAARVHAVSAFFGALTCVFIYLFVYRLIASKSLAYLAALCFGLSLKFWSQSLIAEIYTLNTFFFFLLLYLCFSYSEGKPDRPVTGRISWLFNKPSYLLGSIALLYGLSMTNHWPLMVLSTPALLILLWPKRYEILASLGACLILFLIGLTPYFWMYLHSQSGSYISFYGPLENFSDFWYYLSRQGYSAVDNSFSAGLTDKFQYVGFFLKETASQYGTIGIVLVCIGLWAQFKYVKFELALALITAFFGNGIFLALLLGFDYQLVHQIIFSVYPLIAYGVMGIWLAIGLHWLIDYLYRRTQLEMNRTRLSYILAIGLVAIIFTENLPANNRHDYTWAEEYAGFILNSLDKDAVLFVEDDVAVGTTGYLNRVKKIRPDVALYNPWGLLLGNRLLSPMEDSKETGEQKIKSFIKNTQRPVYFLNNLESGYGYKNHLLYNQVNKSLSPGTVEITLTEANLNFLIALVNQKEIKDPWTNIYRILLLEAIVPELSTVLASGNAGDSAQGLSHVLNESLGLFNCQLARLKWSIEQSDDRYAGEISQLVSAAENNLDNALKKSNVAAFYQQKAKWYLRQDLVDPAFEAYQLSIDTWFHPENESVNEILNLYQLHGKDKSFDDLIERINAMS